MINTDTNKLRAASLLIGDYESIDDIGQKVLSSTFTAIDLDKPTLRFRGTVVDAREGSGNLVITGWQRNVARLRKLDVSLPTIIRMTLDANRVIRKIELDGSFKGSKGLMCCFPYLDRNMKSLLSDTSFDTGFIRRVKQENTHCAHIFEVLSGMYTYYKILETDGFADLAGRGYAYEEEVIDSFIDDGTLHSVGRHSMTEKPTIDYALDLEQIIQAVRFTKQGMLESAKGINATFAIDRKQVIADTVSVNNVSAKERDLAVFLLKCVGAMKSVICPALGTKMLNTNLHPRAYLGMLVQSISIRLFNNNFNYIMHALTSLQRSVEAPLCVGAIENQEEADKCFPGYSFSELV
jgi:hypothetical protein